MKDFNLTDIVYKLAFYGGAWLLGAGAMKVFGVESIFTEPQFNWITLIAVAVSFEIWGMHKVKTAWMAKKDEE